MRYMKDMGISHEQTNVNGGSIAMGHPLGATGAMILGTLIDELERRDLRYGPGHPVRGRRHGHRDDRGARLSGEVTVAGRRTPTASRSSPSTTPAAAPTP